MNYILKLSQYIINNGALCLFFLTILTLSGLAQGNGIGVSEPKVFDNRELIIRLEKLNRRLEAIQVVDQQRLLQSLGLFQGSQVREVARSLSVGTVPIPAVKTTRKPNTVGDLSISEEVTDQKEISASAPSLPSQLSAPKYDVPYGISAEDALQEQINLTYQIYNLQMLLDRSLSDRLLTSKPRLQGLINFQITIDPTNEAKNAAAFVEVTVEPEDKSKFTKPITLVAQMPQEKTYNATALRSKANAFGGSAVLKVLTVGYSEQRRGQTFYLYQDADTITFRRMPQSSSGNNATDMNAFAPTFGWEFRPVLGRQSVTPGTKQMFAVVALPDYDTLDVESKNKNSFKVKVNVKTYWRKYKQSRLTTSYENMDDDSLAVSQYSYTTEIPYSAVIDENLSPNVENVRWYSTGEKSAVVVVQGNNFYNGSTAILGDLIYDDVESGLIIKSSQQLQIATTLDALASGDILINGRYGESKPLLITNPPAVGIRFNTGVESVIEPGRKIGTLKIPLIKKDYSELLLRELPLANSYPIIKIQNTAIKGPYDFQQLEKCNVFIPGKEANEEKKCILMQVPVPAELLNSDSIASIKFPFLGANWTDSMAFLGSAEAPLKLSRLGKTGGVNTLAITGRVFDLPGWQIQIGQNKITPQIIEKTLLTFNASDADFTNNETLIVLPPHGGKPVTLPFKIKPEPPAGPELDANQIAITGVNFVEAVEFKGKGLDNIKEVSFEDTNLKFNVKDGGTKIVVYLTRKVTEKAGRVHVLLRTPNPSDVPLTATVVVK